ncbi:hypothetical protein ACJX0J_032258, partial [Zea mays]
YCNKICVVTNFLLKQHTNGMIHHHIHNDPLIAARLMSPLVQHLYEATTDLINLYMLSGTLLQLKFHVPSSGSLIGLVTRSIDIIFSRDLVVDTITKLRGQLKIWITKTETMIKLLQLMRRKEVLAWLLEEEKKEENITNYQPSQRPERSLVTDSAYSKRDRRLRYAARHAMLLLVEVANRRTTIVVSIIRGRVLYGP